jgi:hypothetical protein
MNTKILSFLITAILFFSFTSFSQVADWEKLGSRVVNYGLDKDIIPVGALKGGFTKLKIRVTGGAVNMHRMVINYKNGSSETIELRHNFSKKSASRTIDIKGGKRLIKNIIFVYDTKNLARMKATIHVFGKH